MFPICAGEDFILSQRSGVEEELFKGDILGVDADVRNGHDMEAGWKQAGPAGQGRNGHWLRWACEHGGYPHITLPGFLRSPSVPSLPTARPLSAINCSAPIVLTLPARRWHQSTTASPTYARCPTCLPAWRRPPASWSEWLCTMLATSWRVWAHCPAKSR